MTVSILALAFGLQGCGGTSHTTLRLALSPDSDSTGLAMMDADGNAFTIASSSAYVRDVEFYLLDSARCSSIPEAERQGFSCSSDDNKLVLRGPFIFDLVSGVSTPSLDDVVVPPGTYRRIDVRFDDADPAEGLVMPGDPMDDRTLLVSGQYASSQGDRAFELSLKFNEDARFESADDVAVDPDLVELRLSLRVADWLSSASIASCAEDGDLPIENDVVMIRDGSGSCSDIENGIKEAIKRSAKLDK